MPVPTVPSPQAYRLASWATGALAFVAAVLTFAFGLAAIIGPAPASDGDRVTTGPAPSGTEGEVLAPDQSVITGTVTKLVGTNVSDAPPLPLPLTLTVAVRGKGTKAEFGGGAVGGKNATISWDGGRPLPLRGQGSLDLNGPVSFELTPAGATWSLDGGARLLTPGAYTFGATVAVSPLNGLATAKDGARLDVPQGAAASLKTNGDVKTTTPAAPITLRGPGALVLEGTLEVRTRDGMRPARKVTFGPGLFELDLEPQGGGFGVVGRSLLQGPSTLDA